MFAATNMKTIAKNRYDTWSSSLYGILHTSGDVPQVVKYEPAALTQKMYLYFRHTLSLSDDLA
jgi:hypothetical protein